MSDCTNGVECCNPSPFPDFPPSIATSLNGLVWAMPCGKKYATSPVPVCNCVDPAQIVATMTGPADDSYTVTFRIRGVVELKASYVGGEVVDGTDGYCYLGGSSNPADTSNTYKMVISSPAATYHLNRWSSGSYGPPRVVDYEFDAEVDVGATVTLIALGLDSVQAQNYENLVVPVNVGDPPLTTSQPYDGQFLEMYVTKIA